jgi:hypothetical protein
VGEVLVDGRNTGEPPFLVYHPHLVSTLKKLSEPFRVAVLATPPKFVSLLGRISPTVQIF